MSRRGRRLALALAGVLAAFAAVEVACHVFGLPRPALQFVGPLREYGDVYREDPDVFWRLRADTPHFMVNRLGMRGYCPEVAKGPRDLRIACVGDSCTFGFLVDYEQTWGVRLERLLQQAYPGRRVESVLAALPCYSTLQNRVQFELEIAPLQPDVTVFYCGAWNDFSPAIGLDDRARNVRNRAREANPLWSLRTVRLVARALADEVSRAPEDYAKLPDGRRVPRDEYVANLTAMVKAARTAGSLAVLVVAPHPESTESARPIAAEYRDLTRQVADATGALLFDAPQLLRNAEGIAGTYGPWFDDWVHPSVAGHNVIAGGVFELICDELGPATDAAPAAPAVIQPPMIELFAGRELVIDVGDLMVDRAWLGEHWLREVRRDAGLLRLGIGGIDEPGSMTLDLITPAGRVRCAQAVAVVPPRIDGEARPTATDVQLTLRGRGPANWLVAAWLASSLRTPPAATDYGTFALADAGPEPVRLEALTLLRLDGRVAADGSWKLETTLTTAQYEAFDDGIYVQGLLIREDQQRSLLTQPGVVKLR